VFTSETKDGLQHHESSTSDQKKILNHLEALCNLVNEGMILNPFKETGTELSTQARLWT